MTNGLLLWVDDEIEQLKAHQLFLEKKGYEVVTVSNGTDAIDQCRERNFDLVLLDEQMPGLSGLETLQKMKEIQPSLPVVMVTKSEEEHIMEQAIGQKIADYLIKPVNPNQILLTLKKNIHRREIETEVTQSQYQQNFQQIAMQILDCKEWKDWVEVYKRLVHWELELSATDSSMTEMLQMQKEDAKPRYSHCSTAARKCFSSCSTPSVTTNGVSSPMSSASSMRSTKTSTAVSCPLPPSMPAMPSSADLCLTRSPRCFPTYG